MEFSVRDLLKKNGTAKLVWIISWLGITQAYWEDLRVPTFWVDVRLIHKR
jgi:hypothetical protein